jgi:hypothetical protein
MCFVLFLPFLLPLPTENPRRRAQFARSEVVTSAVQTSLSMSSLYRWLPVTMLCFLKRGKTYPHLKK